MNNDNKDDNDFDWIWYYLIIAAGMVLMFAIGKALGVPELQGVWGC